MIVIFLRFFFFRFLNCLVIKLGEGWWIEEKLEYIFLVVVNILFVLLIIFCLMLLVDILVCIECVLFLSVVVWWNISIFIYLGEIDEYL